MPDEKWKPILIYVWWFWFISNQIVIQSQFVQPGLCENRCHCPKGEGVVHCDRQDRLSGVPTNLPNGITKLYIQQSHFPTPNYLSRSNLTGLHNLEHLQIIYCNLQIIEPRAFIGMNKLKTLDLSHNAIFRLESFTFYGLQLTSLYLNEQHLTNNRDQSLYISEDAFHLLTASQINLKSNGLTSVSFNTFGKVTHLDRLILSENQIREIGIDFEQYFDHPDKLLDLTGNPLECHCRLAWITRRLSNWLSTLPGLNMTCVIESKNNKKHLFELGKLNADQLCPSSRIKHISVEVMENVQKATIFCTAETVAKHLITLTKPNRNYPQIQFLSNAIPGVAWRYIESGQLREVRRLGSKEEEELEASEGRNATSNMATVQLNVDLSSSIRKYTCATWDDKKDTEEVVVSLKGPNINKTLINHESTAFWTSTGPTNQKLPKSTNQNQLTAVMFEQPHYLFRKQFTLLEMAGSVIGTFLATLIFLLAGARCFRVFQQNHSLFRFTPSCSSMLASDSKGIYLAGKMVKSDHLTQSDQNSSSGKPVNGDTGYHLPLMHDPNATFLNSNHINQQYNNQMALSNLGLGPVGVGKFSPHLKNPYLALSGVLPNSNPSSCAPQDEFLSNLAMLTSTPLLHSSKLQGLMPNEANAMSPFIATNPNHFSQLAVTPGSPYSIAGSHEYDIPRVLDLPNGGSFAHFGTFNQAVYPNASELPNFNNNDFHRS